MKEAGAVVLAGDIAIASEIGEGAAQIAQGLLHDPHGGVGTEIAGAVVEDAAGRLDFGEGICPADADVGVAFVVFELDIEARLVLFYQGLFEDERLDFVFGDEEVDVVDFVAHA